MLDAMLKVEVPCGGWSWVDDAEEACCSPMAPLTTCQLQQCQCQPTSPLRLPQPAFSAAGGRLQRETPVQRALFADDLPRLRLPPALVLGPSEPASMSPTPSASSARSPAAPGGAVEAWLQEMGSRSAGCKALEALQTAQEPEAASATTTASGLPPPAFVLMGLLN